MSEPVIKVEHLSKRYRIGTNQTRYGSLRESLTDALRAPFKKRQAGQDEPDFIWALKDVSFEVEQGEVLGIIGRNGAGKSTLLKILARITKPNEGKVRLRGRVGSLLEVGTGFHPELTGRENIYLNGAVLGMKRLEIQRKFDEIVDFAEIEQFLDTPVKHYSSGMYMRLAFSVAAHLEPEVLLVDEVLAVGDASFQKKCLGKMSEVARGGRTVFFVSHQMGAIRNLSDRCLLLSEGTLIFEGIVEETIRKYLTTYSFYSGTWNRSIKDNTGPLFFERIYITNSKGEITGSILSSEDFTINMRIENNSQVEIRNLQVHIRMVNSEGTPIFTTSNNDVFGNANKIINGTNNLSVTIPGKFLQSGSYSFIAAIIVPRTKLYDIVDNQIPILIEDNSPKNSPIHDGRLGIVTPILSWFKMN
jgi:lipopolysaccharide transport system ATP-binding protein